MNKVTIAMVSIMVAGVVGFGGFVLGTRTASKPAVTPAPYVKVDNGTASNAQLTKELRSVYGDLETLDARVQCLAASTPRPVGGC